MFHATTHDISVSAMPVYIDERSRPENNQYFWAYRIIIRNKSRRRVQLLSRYWRIIDGNGVVKEVRGEGVVGEQPVLRPGEFYEYTSGCPLSTPSGFMKGSYVMCDDTGACFEVAIPAFPLDLPDATPILN